MMYITHISSKSSVFETFRANKSMNLCLILMSIEYSQVFILVLSITMYSRIQVFVIFVRIHLVNTRANASIGSRTYANIHFRDYILAQTSMNELCMFCHCHSSSFSSY